MVASGDASGDAIAGTDSVALAAEDASGEELPPAPPAGRQATATRTRIRKQVTNAARRISLRKCGSSYALPS
jgi:hypothetical protein